MSSRFEYYDNAESLVKMAENLERFPRHKADVFLYEIGSDKPEDRFAYYFRFRVFTTDPRGGSAIQRRFCNNNDWPYAEIAEFCIQTEPAAINRLGRLFREYSKPEKDYLVWLEPDSSVGDKHEYA